MNPPVNLPTKLSDNPDKPNPGFIRAADLQAVRCGPLLGEGESARVYEARSPAGDRCVLKVARPGFESVLLHEARVLALCDGECVPVLDGVGRYGPGQEIALLLRRLPGVSLARVTNIGDAEREALAWRVLGEGAQALDHLHAYGISHGDVKPDNVVLDPHEVGSLWLIDFGLSGPFAEVQRGTPRYLPPEVLRGERISSRIADTYGLALCVAQLLEPSLIGEPAVGVHTFERFSDELRHLLEPILRPEATSRPGADWLCQELSHSRRGHPNTPAKRLADIRRHYVLTRLSDIRGASSRLEDLPAGLPGRWIQRICERLREIERLGRSVDVVAPDGGRSWAFDADGAGGRQTLPNLSVHDRRRFLGRLFGPHATSWHLPLGTDEQLVDALRSISEYKALSSVLPAELIAEMSDSESGKHEEPPREEEGVQRDIHWALQLAKRPVHAALLRRIEAADDVAEPLKIQAASLARLIGNPQLAVRLVRGLNSDAARLEGALSAQRLGQGEEAKRILESLCDAESTPEVRSRAAAAVARRHWDEGRLDAALSVLGKVAPDAATEEVRALCHLSRGDFDLAGEALDQGEAWASSDEESARLWGVRGMIEHRQGASAAALESFSRASELASRAGAALEEATYCTGVAAAASDAKRLDAALAASERAESIFESLGLPAQTARALLSRAAALASLGATAELRSVVARGIDLARRSGDTTCEAYLCLSQCDGDEDQDRARGAARRAAELLEGGSIADRLRCAARLLRTGESPAPEAFEWVTLCDEPEALVDWYGARAEALLRASSHGSTETTRSAAGEVVGRLIELAQRGSSKNPLGSALVAGAHLALRVTMAEEARTMLRLARDLADEFLAHVPAGYRVQAENLLWVQQARGGHLDASSGSAQLSDVESLLRSLSQRRGFRALLDQVLDLLLLWTRVERGLLLLRAPGEKLVIRAARNLDKADLSAEQRALSQSLAKRALDEGRPIVLVDAVHDVSHVHKSVHALNLRSVLAVPLVARGEVLGVAYLDDKVRRGAFGERELAWVGLIGTIAALTIADERDRLQLERALRRARRAERRLETQLVTREAQLEIAERELGRMRDGRKLRGNYSQIVGRSPKMATLLELVDRVANSDIPVLIQGESGTGKELIARALATSGPRKDKAFVAENCSAVPETLLESALFGHHKGAFTGATRNQAGLFDLADRGTLFLDEIGDMSMSMQTKLLRVLQEGEVRPLGSERMRKVDVRVIVATHMDLKELVDGGKFREDLYYRLNVVTLQLPPLRERREDIAELIRHFIQKYSGGHTRDVSPAAVSLLANFSWPGNVRQLENEVRRMLVLGGEQITAADLSPEIQNDEVAGFEAKTLREKVDALERRLVIEALHQERGNRTRAAEVLGVSRFGLQKMTQRLGIDLSRNPQKGGRIKARGLDD